MLVLWYGGTLIFSDHSPIDAPTFIFYMVILYSIIQPLKDFSKASYNIPKGMASVERINKILNAENPITEAANPVRVDGLHDCIEFRNVSFSYNGTTPVLTDVNLTVRRGQTIALVGQSGSGKSTLVDLLPRYHDVSGGEILIDGKNVKTLALSDLRALIGNVNQEAILFNDSFYNNITFGVEQATMEEVIEAAKLDGATGIKKFFYVVFPQVFGTVSTFLIIGVAGIFTNQINLFSFYEASAPDDVRTLGYYLYVRAQLAVNEAEFPELSALGLLLTAIAVPLTMLVKRLLEKFGYSED